MGASPAIVEQSESACFTDWTAIASDILPVTKKLISGDIGQYAKLVKDGKLITYPGFPHGMPTTEAATINADLLAFIQS